MLLILLFIFRFLTTGEAYASLSVQYHVGLSSISKLVPVVCQAIWHTLQPVTMSMPETAEECQKIAMDFNKGGTTLTA